MLYHKSLRYLVYLESVIIAGHSSVSPGSLESLLKMVKAGSAEGSLATSRIKKLDMNDIMFPLWFSSSVVDRRLSLGMMVIGHGLHFH